MFGPLLLHFTEFVSHIETLIRTGVLKLKQGRHGVIRKGDCDMIRRLGVAAFGLGSGAVDDLRRGM